MDTDQIIFKTRWAKIAHGKRKILATKTAEIPPVVVIMGIYALRIKEKEGYIKCRFLNMFFGVGVVPKW